MIVAEGCPGPTNHGSVLVTLDGIDYVADPGFGSFKVLPLVPGAPASAGEGIFEIRAIPSGTGFEILMYMAHNREELLPFRTEPDHDPVDHAFFLARYDWSSKNGPFNDALFIRYQFPDRILSISRLNKFTVAADGTVSKTEMTDAERKDALADEFGLSREIIEALPPDVAGGAVFF